MKVKFTVDRLRRTVVAEPCDSDAALERLRVGQDILSGENFVAAISRREFSPVQLVDREFLEALAEAFALAREFETELKCAQIEEFD